MNVLNIQFYYFLFKFTLDITIKYSKEKRNNFIFAILTEIKLMVVLHHFTLNTHNDYYYCHIDYI
jgi:hypothetical protein